MIIRLTNLSLFIVTISLVALLSCKSNEHYADIIFTNGKIYTVDSTLVWAEAVAVSGGKISKVYASGQNYNGELGPDTEVIDLKGQFMMPGFIEGHGHFSGLGESIINLNLLYARSWDEVIEKIAEKVAIAQPGQWIEGRGWHQEKWDSIPQLNIHGYPYHHELSAISPNNPVVLTHASGHSLFANQAAMTAAGVSTETPNPAGGEIVRDFRKNAIGVFEERAMAPVREALATYKSQLSQEELEAKWYRAIEEAQDECLRKGITSFQDAGSKFFELARYQKMAEEGKLRLRLWAMARDTFGSLRDNLAKHKAIGVGDNFYTCNAIKSEVDGALGAFGAWLLEPYSDKPGFVGQNTTDIYTVKKIADLAVKHEMQFCVHAIGDRANRVVLDIYEGMMEQAGPKSDDWRWRIEHAQHLNTADIPRFAEHDIIASMQGIHCTSDAPFVEKRLGNERSKLGAYAWRSLIDAGVLVANGTDAPVEDVDPLLSYYASVTRKRADNGFEFFTEQAMTREEAIKSYTIWNAFAAKEELIKGSISVGKVADFVVLDQDLIHCSDDDILKTKVLMTVVDGKVMFKR